MALTLAAIGTGTAGVQPAGAAACAQPAQVYIGNVQAAPGPGQPVETIVRHETDPIDGPVPDVYPPYALPAFTLGGVGITPGESPTFDFYSSSGQYVATVVGARADDNCVSGRINVDKNGLGIGLIYLVRASYHSGNTGKIIGQQRLVSLHSL